MDCPRCGGRLTRYRLGDRETLGCQQCAYVGVSVDHTATRGSPESWDDAIDRFKQQGQTVTRVTYAELPAEIPTTEATETGEAVARNLADGDELVIPVFERGDGETTEPPEDGESADSS
jgi:hypothetical protein